MRLLVLYSELAGYFNACIDVFQQQTGADILVVHWKVNGQAPFVFSARAGIRHVEKTTFVNKTALLHSAEAFQPDMVLVSGWMDKEYLFVAQSLKQRGLPVIMASDTQWKGSFRQQVAALAGPWYLKKYFTHAWVTGLDQFEFARRLGFGRENVQLGVYAANQSLFHASFVAYSSAKAAAYPRTFIFVGRFVPEKGVELLYDVFRSIPVQERQGWTLQLVGTGPLHEKLTAVEGIVVHPFTQPEQLPSLFSQSGCFVMPSLYEPWGVVAHEACAAGLPLLLSDHVGASSAFLHDGYNGFSFSSGNAYALKQAMQKIIQLPEGALITMGERSASLSFQNTPEIWSCTLLSIYHTHTRTPKKEATGGND